MNSRQRAITALELGVPDRVPIFDAMVDFPLVKEITGEQIRLTTSTMKKDLKTMADCNRKLGLDFLVYYPGYAAAEGGPVTRVAEKTYVDAWGAIRRRLDFPVFEDFYVGGTINSEEDYDKFEPPDPQQTVDLIAGLESTFRRIREDLLLVGGTVGGVIIGMEMRGIANFLVDCYRRPQFARRIMDMVYHFNTEVCKAMVDVGVDAILYDDDYAETRGPLLSPVVWRGLVKKYQADFVAEFKKKGLWVIHHSDGNLNLILKDLVASGIDALHPIEPTAMNIGKVKKEYGHGLCVIGNVDCGNTMTLGNEDDVRKDVRRCIDEAAAGGGHILSSSNSLHWQIPVRNVLAMVDEAKRYGKYPTASEKTIPRRN